MEFTQNPGINKHIIKLLEGKQPSYGLIYILSLVELKTLKAYIETNLKTRFIQSSKSPTSASILCDKKLISSFCLCVNY